MKISYKSLKRLALRDNFVTEISNGDGLTFSGAVSQYSCTDEGDIEECGPTVGHDRMINLLHA